MAFSSEALKQGLAPSKDLRYTQLKEWVKSNIDPDSMGFDGPECIPDDVVDYYNKLPAPKLLKAVAPYEDLSIIPYLTITNFNNSNRALNTIQWIVLHYTAGKGDTAKGNCSYFYSVYRGASAHYFVDETSIYQCVLDNDIAWHCGTTGKYYSACRNSTSIGIEMCSDFKNGAYYISDATVARTLKLVKYLMKKYNIDKSHVIMHYNVTHKNCPAPWMINTSLWTAFQNNIILDNITILVNSVATKLQLSSSSYWINILNGVEAPKPEYIKKIFEKVCIAAGKSYTDKLIYTVADGVLNLNSDEYWQNVIVGKALSSAENMYALFSKIDSVL